MNEKTVLYSFSDRVARITLNRPDKRNALNGETVVALENALDRATEDCAKVTILTGAGSAFCAGADLAYLQQLQVNTYSENLEDSHRLARVFQKISSHSSVIIGRIDGPAIAGGCGLATVCDFSIASEGSMFGYTEVRIGFIPAIVMVYLNNKIGSGRARDLLLSGRLVNASEAVELGLINRVVPSDELDSAVNELAETIVLQNSAQSMALVKEMFIGIQGKTQEEAVDYAAQMNAKARETDDCRKGISAFLNKEKITWQ
ncbi:MAG: enoyl-CoA hydratase/isomerase family protein [Flavobacteriales bacterium]|nr:enoyl-CoA hydratase/isomerase family protein [Flavobacteriales bacterium]